MEALAVFVAAELVRIDRKPSGLVERLSAALGQAHHVRTMNLVSIRQGRFMTLPCMVRRPNNLKR